MPPYFFSPLRDWHQCVKSQGVWGRIPQGLVPRSVDIPFQQSAVCWIIVVSFAGSIAVVLFLCDCTPTHPFVNNISLTADGPVQRTGHGVFRSTIPWQRVALIK